MSTVCVSAPETALGREAHSARPEARGATSFPVWANTPAAQMLYRVGVRCWAGILKVLASQRPGKKYLRVCESVSLGDKRFVAVVQAGQERFLVGGAANSIALLTRLSEPSPTFSAAMKDCADAGPDIQ